MTAALTLATGERAVIYYLTGPGFISGLKACLIDGQADSPSHFLSIRKLNYSTLLFLRGPGSTD
jgi:hypothetical protein